MPAHIRTIPLEQGYVTRSKSRMPLTIFVFVLALISGSKAIP